QQQLVWEDVSVAGELARRLIEELAGLDPTRLRRCAREQCGLFFYDSTRSRTQRWHAEDPCGWRERQHSRRAPGWRGPTPPAPRAGDRSTRPRSQPDSSDSSTALKTASMSSVNRTNRASSSWLGVRLTVLSAIRAASPAGHP